MKRISPKPILAERTPSGASSVWGQFRDESPNGQSGWQEENWKNDRPGYPTSAGRAPWALVTGTGPLKLSRSKKVEPQICQAGSAEAFEGFAATGREHCFLRPVLRPAQTGSASDNNAPSLLDHAPHSAKSGVGFQPMDIEVLIAKMPMPHSNRCAQSAQKQHALFYGLLYFTPPSNYSPTYPPRFPSDQRTRAGAFLPGTGTITWQPRFKSELP